jgi:hypothetical protein
MRPAQFLLRRSTHENPNIRRQKMTIDSEIIKTASVLIIAFAIGWPIGRAFAGWMLRRGWWE